MIGETFLFLDQLEDMVEYDLWLNLYSELTDKLNLGAHPMRVMKEMGYKKKHPLVLVPGFASTCLAVQSTEKKQWENERVWLNLRAIGAANFAAMKRKIRTKVHSDQANLIAGECTQNDWVSHLLLGEDGWHDTFSRYTHNIQL